MMRCFENRPTLRSRKSANSMDRLLRVGSVRIAINYDFVWRNVEPDRTAHMQHVRLHLGFVLSAIFRREFRLNNQEHSRGIFCRDNEIRRKWHQCLSELIMTEKE